MSTQKIYDILGIGIGPFNLGLAALAHPIKELSCLFIDQREEFNWHPGMMLESARLQVPFYADLVTLADPRSEFSFLNFLHGKKEMFRFAVRENYYIKRTLYNQYCRWVAERLPSLRFSTACQQIEKQGAFYKVRTSGGEFLAQKIILGTGTMAFIPEFSKMPQEGVLHSADYLPQKESLLQSPSVTIVGSGQSAAEIFYDLLPTYDGKLSWFTRADRFFPMDYSKLSLEMSSPYYIDHFYSLPERKRAEQLRKQDSLYKGINTELITAIYEALDEKNSGSVSLHPGCELTKIAADLTLTFLHSGLEKSFTHATARLILATGYAPAMPACIKPLRPYLQLDSEGRYRANRNYSVDRENSIFIQNAEMTTHGFNAPDLSLGPYRNAVILNTILEREQYPVETGKGFQVFGLPAAG